MITACYYFRSPIWLCHLLVRHLALPLSEPNLFRSSHPPSPSVSSNRAGSIHSPFPNDPPCPLQPLSFLPSLHHPEEPGGGGRSRGYAFVTMEDAKDASDAVRDVSDCAIIILFRVFNLPSSFLLSCRVRASSSMDARSR